MEQVLQMICETILSLSNASAAPIASDVSSNNMLLVAFGVIVVLAVTAYYLKYCKKD